MELSDLFGQFEIEFELDLPEEAEASLVCMRDVRDYIRQVYREQGIDTPSVAIFERLRRLTAQLTDTPASKIEPATRLTDLLAHQPSRAA